MKLSPEELLDPPADTAIVDGMTVVIGTTRTFDEEVASDIAPTIVYDNDPTQPASYVKIVPGAPGVMSTTNRVTLKNGVETGRAKVGVPKVIQAPIATHRIYGGRQGAIPAAGAVPGNYKKKLSGVRATWYNAQHGGKAFDDPWYGITATGAHLDFGICAVDPSVIPFHTLMWIPGYGTCLAEDTGGGIRGLHVDLGYPESVGDPGWGDRVVEVYILD
jgi:3D (Asp-Asp-Asp) domain-containing protein